jgi:hypothetical protein
MKAAISALLLSAAALLPCFIGMPFSCGRRAHPRWMFLSALLCFAICFSTALAAPDLKFLPVLISAALFLAWAVLFSGEAPHIRLAAAAAHLCGAVVSFMIAVLTLLPDRSPSTVFSLTFPQLCCFSLILLFTGVIPMCAVSILMRIFLRRGDDRRTNLVWLLFLPFPLCQYFLIDRSLPADDAGYRQAIYLLLAVVLCLGADVALAFGVRSVARSAALRTRYDALNRQIKAQTVYYRQVAEYCERIRQLRHDLRNHVYTVKILLADDPGKASAYAEQLRKESLSAASAPLCAHPIADLFLSQKLADLAKEGLTLRLDLSLPAALHIPNGDLIAALDHLIEYAAACCRERHGTEITLHAVYAEPFLILKVEPAFARAPHRIPRETEPTGIVVLKRLAERYAGDLSVRDAQGTETAVLLLREGAAV